MIIRKQLGTSVTYYDPEVWDRGFAVHVNSEFTRETLDKIRKLWGDVPECQNIERRLVLIEMGRIN